MVSTDTCKFSLVPFAPVGFEGKPVRGDGGEIDSIYFEGEFYRGPGRGIKAYP